MPIAYCTRRRREDSPHAYRATPLELAQGCDLLVVNAVGDGKAFGTEDNTGWLLAANGNETSLPYGSKTLMASRILDEVRALVPDGRGA